MITMTTAFGHVDTYLDDRGRDQHVDQAVGEGQHGLLFLLGGQPAVQDRQPQPGQRPCGQLGGQVKYRDRRTAPGSVRLIHQLQGVTDAAVGTGDGSQGGAFLGAVRPVATDPRADHVRLPPGSDLLLDPLPGPGQVSAAALPPGTTWVLIGDRPAGSSVSVETSRSPNTVIATVRGIGVAVITSMCGRPSPGLVPQRVPLLDAEPVLLVDDHQAEVSELHPVFEQGMRADDDPGATGGGLQQRFAPASGAHRASQQGQPRGMLSAAELTRHAERPEHAGDRPVVLLRQHLGRCEQGCLAGGVDYLQHGPQRDDRLAGADLTLQQPVHRMLALQVGRDGRAGRQLAVGQLERQGVVEVLEPARRGPAAAGSRCS